MKTRTEMQADREAQRQRVLESSFYRNGGTFRVCQVTGLLRNGTSPEAARRLMRHMCDMGDVTITHERGGVYYLAAKRSWLQKPWRLKTDEQLGVDVAICMGVLSYTGLTFADLRARLCA